LSERDYNAKQKLSLEMFYMGAYISEHPLDKFPYVDLESAQEGEQVKIAGIVTGVTVKKTKKNNDYLTIKFKSKDDIERNTNVFNEEKVQSLQKDLKKNQIIVVTGTFSRRYHNINAYDVKIQIDKKQLLNQENIQIKKQEQQQEIQIPVSTVPFASLF